MPRSEQTITLGKILLPTHGTQCSINTADASGPSGATCYYYSRRTSVCRTHHFLLGGELPHVILLFWDTRWCTPRPHLRPSQSHVTGTHQHPEGTPSRRRGLLEMCLYYSQKHMTARIFLPTSSLCHPEEGGRWCSLLLSKPTLPGPSVYWQQSWIQSGLRLPSQASFQEGSFAALGFFAGCEQPCRWWGPPVATLNKCVNRHTPLFWTRPAQFKDTEGWTRRKMTCFSTSLTPYGKFIGQSPGCRETIAPSYKL